MPTRPRLSRSIPFWGLVVVSLATIAGGWYLTTDKLGSMTTKLTDGSATGVDVYVGQSVAQLGSILIGAGIIGILLAFGVAALSTLRPHAPAETVEAIDWQAESDTAADDVIVAAPVVADAEPVAEVVEPVAEVAEPAVEAEPATDVKPEADSAR